jgi:hypothetical protein
MPNLFNHVDLIYVIRRGGEGGGMLEKPAAPNAADGQN